MDYKEFLTYFPDHCIQLFDDNQTVDAKKDETKAKTIAGGKVNWEMINKANQTGSGIYFSVNRFPNGVRQTRYCAGVNAWYAESDKLSVDEQLKVIESLNLTPSFVVRSKKSLHTYWLAKDATMDNFKLIQTWIAKRLNGDPVMKDFARVLRVPEFYHMKDPLNPFRVEIIIDNHHLLYTEQQLLDEFVDFEQIKKDEEEKVAKLKALEEKYNFDGNDVFSAINNIPIEFVVCKIMNWTFDGIKHWYANGSKAPSACFKAKDGNYILHGGTQHFSGDQDGYNPFSFVKMYYNFDNRDTFEWFKRNYEKIREIDYQEKEKYFNNQNNLIKQIYGNIKG